MADLATRYTELKVDLVARYERDELSATDKLDLAAIYLVQKENSDAIALYTDLAEATESLESGRRAKLWLAYCYTVIDYDQSRLDAIEELTSSLMDVDDDNSAGALIVASHAMMGVDGDMSMARINALEECIRRRPDWVLPYFYLAKIYEEMRAPQAALDAYLGAQGKTHDPADDLSPDERNFEVWITGRTATQWVGSHIEESIKELQDGLARLRQS